MKVGLLYDMRYRPAQHGSFSKFYADTLEHMQEMERLGFESLNVCEHHFDSDPFTTTSLMVWNGAMAVKTTRALIGQDILCIPYAHPVRIAEDLANIDVLSNGRAWLQAGEAYRPVEFESFGISMKQRGGRTTEGLDIIRKCFTEEEFSYEGKYYQLKDVRMFPKPLQKPHPLMFRVQGVGTRPMEVSVQMDLHATSTGGNGERWNAWHKGWTDTIRRHGKDPAKFQSSVFFALFATDDPERDWNKYKQDEARTSEAAARFRLPRSEWETWKAPSPAAPAANPFMTPDEAVKYLRRCYGDNPPTHLILWSKRAGMPYAESVRHHRLFMEKVAPKLRDLK